MSCDIQNLRASIFSDHSYTGSQSSLGLQGSNNLRRRAPGLNSKAPSSGLHRKSLRAPGLRQHPFWDPGYRSRLSHNTLKCLTHEMYINPV